MTMPVPAGGLPLGAIPATVEPEAAAMDAEVARAFRAVLTAALGEGVPVRGRRRLGEAGVELAAVLVPPGEQRGVAEGPGPVVESIAALSVTTPVALAPATNAASAPQPEVVTGEMVHMLETIPAPARPPVDWIPEAELVPEEAFAGDVVGGPPDIVIGPVTMPSLDLVRTVGASDPASPTAALEALVPEVRGRLERVVERMKREFGVTVEVIETSRTQERQDALFAQGRTTPGPVVTWTRASRHAHGLAADVTVNGGWTDRAAFERLAVVAREEGLRTLGPRDPGHIELVAGATNTPESGPAPAIVRAMRHPQGVIAPRTHDVARVRDEVPGFTGRSMTDGEVHALPWYPTPADGTTLVPDRSRAAPRGSAGGTSAALALGTRAEALAVRAEQQPIVGPPTVAVAAVSQVASVATVARVALPGRAPGAGEPAAEESRPLDPHVAREALVTRARGTGVAHAAERAVERSPTLAPYLPAPVEGSPDHDDIALQLGTGAEQQPSLSSPAPETAPITADQELSSLAPSERAAPEAAAQVKSIDRTDAVERIARVLRLQDALGERPVTSVTLRLDQPAGGGGEDRIRIDLRGRSVASTFDIADQRSADSLRVHAHELQAALERRGLDGEGIVVRAATESLNVATAAAAEREQVRAASASQSGTGTGGHSRDQRAPRDPHPGARDHEQQGSRPRRDQGGRRS